MQWLVLALLWLTAIAAPAAAEPRGKTVEMLPGVTENATPSIVFMNAAIGRLGIDSRGDNVRNEPAKNSGWTYGLNFRGESVPLDTRYGGSVGAAFDLDVFVVSPGALSDRQEPNSSYLYMGFTPALALGVFRTQSLALSLELGAPLNTDFYGVSAGAFGRVGWFYFGYRMRTGKGWDGQEFLDERMRFGVHGTGGSYALKPFFGFEIIDGYGEDSKGRSNLGSLMRGSYTMVSLLISVGK